MLDRNTVNKVILMGRIGHEPRWHTVMGQKMLHFPLIISEKIKKGYEMVTHEETNAINIPENCVPLDKLITGTIVYVQGRLQTRVSIDENFVRHYRTEVVANSVDIISAAFTPVQID